MAGEVSSCPTCRRPLLVDVIVDKAAAPGRQRLAVAHALASLGAPAPGFVKAQELLAKEGQVLVRGVSPAFAARVLEVLREGGLRGSVAGHEERRVDLSWLGVATAAVVAVALVGAGAVQWLHAHGKTTPFDGLVAAAGVAPVPVVPVTLTTAQLGDLALGSVARVACGNSVGAGFFIEPDVLVTNAHVACGLNEPQQVTLRDGGTTTGITSFRDEWVDLARVQVTGARARPLAAGDSTALLLGEPVVFVGSPRGLDFTTHEGKVSFVGREYLGVGYLQLDGTVNPGNSGGPVLDRHGRVVGVVSMKVMDAEGIGLALPIEYAVPPDGLADAGVGPAARWAALLERVAQADAREAAALHTEGEHPTLLGVTLEGDEDLPVAVFTERWAGPPRPVKHTLVLEAPGQKRCTLAGTTGGWAPFTLPTEAQAPRRVQWLVRHGANEGLVRSRAPLTLVSCPEFVPTAGATLTDENGTPPDNAVKVPLEALTPVLLRLRDLEFDQGGGGAAGTP